MILALQLYFHRFGTTKIASKFKTNHLWQFVVLFEFFGAGKMNPQDFGDQHQFHLAAWKCGPDRFLREFKIAKSVSMVNDKPKYDFQKGGK